MSKNPFATIADRKFLLAMLAVLAVIVVLVARFWYLQVYRGDHYRRISHNNRMRKIEIPAPRGIIHDRYGRVMVGNRPAFDLLYVRRNKSLSAKTLELLAELVETPVNSLKKRLALGEGRPRFLPVVLKHNLSQHEVSVLQVNKILFKSIDLRMSPQRHYHPELPVHLIGYLGRIDMKTLKRYRLLYPDKGYLAGDLVGKQGIEGRWEHLLRGQRGFEVIQVNAHGRQSHKLDRPLPRQEAVPGANLVLTIDWRLQRQVARIFKGKRGAVIVLDPRNGELLAMLSNPQFDPYMYQRRLTTQRWQALLANPFHPLLDKTSGGEYPPGSIYKVIVALAALGDKIINPQDRIKCHGSFTLGKDTFHCHKRSGHGEVNLKRALVESCDVYFYHLGLELGVDRIAHYADKFALGRRLQFNLNLERPGLIPTRSWKQRRYRQPWSQGETPNIAIGQGYNLMTPLQMASLYAAIANGGTIWQPFVVRRVVDHYGRTIESHRPQIRQRVAIDSDDLRLLRRYLKLAVSDRRATGYRAFLPGIEIAGKTGSIQVVSLKRYQDDLDVSIKWKEHAIFAAFSPVKNPELVVVVVSENDSIGGGGTAAAPLAREIIASYYRGKSLAKSLTNP